MAMGSLQVEETSAYCTVNHRAEVGGENWIAHATSIPINFSPVEIRFGYLNPDNFYPINTIILVTKIDISSKS